MQKRKLYTLGYTLFSRDGRIDVERMFEELVKLDVTHLIDVRSYPYSNQYPDSNGDQLKRVGLLYGIEYAHIKSLGAKAEGLSVFSPALEIFPESEVFPIAKSSRPEYEELKAYEEIVDFKKFTTHTDFLQGIQRISIAYQKGFTLALMCNEKNPMDCHRFFYIGTKVEEIMGDYIEVCHLLVDQERGGLKGVSNDQLFRNLEQRIMSDSKIRSLDIQQMDLFEGCCPIDKYDGNSDEERLRDFCLRYWNLIHGWKRKD